MALSFMQRGKASQDIAKREEAEAAARKDEMGKLWHFWLDRDDTAPIIFVDGVLEDGHLMPPRFYEHNVKRQGRWVQYVCPEKTMPEAGHKCPLCEEGERAGLVAVFTIIDLRPYKTKKDEVIPFQKKIFKATPGQMQILDKMAASRGGLAGWKVEVSRGSKENSARTGEVFDFQGKLTSADTQKFIAPKKDAKTGKVIGKENLFVPANYDEEFTFRGEEELRKLGFGTAGNYVPGAYSAPDMNFEGTGSSTAGEEAGAQTEEATEGATDYSSLL